MVLVVGSQNSSNSQRLAELARTCGVAAHLIDGPGDIDLAWFSSPKKGDCPPLCDDQRCRCPPPAGPFRQSWSGTVPLFRSGEQTVVVTAGASAPEALVQKCVRLVAGAFRGFGGNAHDLPRATAVSPAENVVEVYSACIPHTPCVGCGTRRLPPTICGRHLGGKHENP